MEIEIPFFSIPFGFIEEIRSQGPAPTGEGFKVHLKGEFIFGEGGENIPQHMKGLKKPVGIFTEAFEQGFGDSEVLGFISPFDQWPADSLLEFPFLPDFDNPIQAKGFNSKTYPEAISDLPFLFEEKAFGGQWMIGSETVLEPEIDSHMPPPSTIPLSISMAVWGQGGIVSGSVDSEAQPLPPYFNLTHGNDRVIGFSQGDRGSVKQEIQSASSTVNKEEKMGVDPIRFMSDSANVRSVPQANEMMHSSAKPFSNLPYLLAPSQTENPTDPFPFFQGNGNSYSHHRPFNPKPEGMSPLIDAVSKEAGRIVLEKEEGNAFTTHEKQNENNLSLLFVQNGHQKTSSARPSGPNHGQEASTKGEFPEIYQQIGRRVVYSLKNNEERIKLTLDPPELGNIYMEINREKSIIKAILWADHQGTKEILEAHQTQLQKMLREDGFELKRFDVFVRQEASSFLDERRGGPTDPHGHRPHRETAESERLGYFEPLSLSPEIIYPFPRWTHTLDLFV